jgi:hypothetical protein
MAYPTMQTKFALAHIAFIAMLSGCQFSLDGDPVAHPDALSASVKKVPVFEQLIIKFKPNTITCDADAIARLSLSIKVRIEFIRPISDQICVIRQYANNEIDLSKGEFLIRQHPDVAWLELDSIKKAL